MELQAIVKKVVFFDIITEIFNQKVCLVGPCHDQTHHNTQLLISWFWLLVPAIL